MEIIEYDSRYKQDFIDLNTAWIKKYFGSLEEEDYREFNNLESMLENGAMIFFAVEENAVLAVCMTMPLKDGEWEICKFAADEKFKGRGAGSAVFEAAMKYAISKGGREIRLISNTKLKPALHIYKKYGFREIKSNNYGYVRGDIALKYTAPGLGDATEEKNDRSSR